jgi:hypothetical protein
MYYRETVAGCSRTLLPVGALVESTHLPVPGSLATLNIQAPGRRRGPTEVLVLINLKNEIFEF